MDNIVVADIIITDNCANQGLKPIEVNMSGPKNYNATLPTIN